MDKNAIYIEYRWAYDWRLTYQIEWEDFERHRINWAKIIKKEQKEEYWPIKFTTENWEEFINLTKI